MISVLTLHNEVRNGLNRLNSNWDTSVHAVDIDSALNKAKDFLLENYSRLAERSKTFENMLKELEVVDKSLQTVNQPGKDYSVGILPKDYYDYLSIHAKAMSLDKKCQDIIWNSNYFQRDDNVLNDPNYNPSWEWRTGVYNLSEQGVLYYHNKEYIVTNIIMSYVKKIPDIAAPSLVEQEAYKKADGSVITRNKHLQITHPVFWRKMCALAIFYIRSYMDSSYKQTIDEIMFNEATAINPHK